MRHETSHPDEERLLQYTDDELSSRGGASVRAHLEACSRCQAELEELREALAEYAQSEMTVRGPASWAGFESRLDLLIAQRGKRRGAGALAWGISVAAAAVVFAGFAVWQLNR